MLTAVSHNFFFVNINKVEAFRSAPLKPKLCRKTVLTTSTREEELGSDIVGNAEHSATV
jgi:hypothetical protein